MYYNNPGRYLVGALVEDGRVRTKWTDAPPDKPVLTDRAKEIIAEIKAEQGQTGPVGQFIVNHQMKDTLEIMKFKGKPQPKPREPTVRKKKVVENTTTAKLFDE